MLQLPPPNCRHDGNLPPREPGDAPCYVCHSRHVHGGSAFCKGCGVAIPTTKRHKDGRRCIPCRREYEAAKQREARLLRGQYRNRNKEQASV